MRAETYAYDRAVAHHIDSGKRPSLLATEISRISMLDEVAVSRALSVLARRGFVQKRRNRQDKRAREVSLTPAGWRYYGAIMPRMREQNEIIRGLFNQGELSALYGALDRIDDLFKELSAQRRLYGETSIFKTWLTGNFVRLATGVENRHPSQEIAGEYEVSDELRSARISACEQSSRDGIH